MMLVECAPVLHPPSGHPLIRAEQLDGVIQWGGPYTQPRPGGAPWLHGWVTYRCARLRPPIGMGGLLIIGPPHASTTPTSSPSPKGDKPPITTRYSGCISKKHNIYSSHQAGPGPNYPQGVSRPGGGSGGKAYGFTTGEGPGQAWRCKK